MEFSRKSGVYNSKKLGGEISFETILKAFSKKGCLKS